MTFEYGLSVIEHPFWEDAERTAVIERANSGAESRIVLLRTEEVTSDQRVLNDLEICYSKHGCLSKGLNYCGAGFSIDSMSSHGFCGLPPAECKRRLQVVADQLSFMLQSIELRSFNTAAPARGRQFGGPARATS